MQASLTSSSLRKTHQQLDNVALAEAKTWIGRVLLLKNNWLGFKPGMRCRVMCVVDFGDGLLLWVITDDEHSREVDQVEFSFLDDLFIPLPIEIQPSRLLPSVMSVA